MLHMSSRWTSCAALALILPTIQVLAGRGRHHHDDHALDHSDVVRLGVTPNGRFRLHLPVANVELEGVQDSDVEYSNYPDPEHDQSEQTAVGQEGGGIASSQREHSGRQRLTLSKGHAAQPESVSNNTSLPVRSMQGASDQTNIEAEQQSEPAKLESSEQPSEVMNETKEQLDQYRGDPSENSQTENSELEDLGVDNVSMQDFSETDEASARLAATAIDQAELNLEVIRKFPKMSLWETRLREAIVEAGGSGARCSDLKDTMFRGYGCGIRDNGQALCTCHGGHEDCQMHDSEDVLDYLWTVKQNKTVDENVMRELLAGRCDYLGGHAVSWFEIGAILGVILTPVVFACICCFAPVVTTKSVFSGKGAAQRRAPGLRQASPSSSARAQAEGSSSARQPETQASPSNSERQ